MTPAERFEKWWLALRANSARQVAIDAWNEQQNEIDALNAQLLNAVEAYDIEKKELAEAKEEACRFGKDQLFHRCTSGTNSIRPYPKLLCSICKPGTGDEVNFNAFEEVERLTDKLREAEERLKHYAEQVKFDRRLEIATARAEALEDARGVVEQAVRIIIRGLKERQ